MFNQILYWLWSEDPINAALLRIMNQRFEDAYNTLDDKVPYIPGLEHWLGFRYSWVSIHIARDPSENPATLLENALGWR